MNEDQMIHKNAMSLSSSAVKEPEPFPSVVRFMSEDSYYKSARAAKEKEDAARLEMAEPVVSALERRLNQENLFDRVLVETGIREKVLRALLDRCAPCDLMHVHGVDLVGAAEWGDALVALGEWLKRDARTRKGATDHAPTPTLKAIYSLLADAMDHGLLKVIIGPVGIGKTFAAETFAADRPRSPSTRGAIRIELNSADVTVNQCTQTILKRLRHDSHGEGGFRELCRVLRSGDLLILDESQRLAGCGRGAMVDIVRDLWRDTGAGIVLMGNPRIKDQREGIVGNDTYAAFLSRAEVHDLATGTTRADVESWMLWKGFSGKALCDALTEFATHPIRWHYGGIRDLANLVEAIERRNQGEKATSESLLDALQKLRGKR